MTGETVSLILAISVTLFFLGLLCFLIASYIYKRKHNIPTGDCAGCRLNTKKLLKEYHKKYHSN